MIKKILTIIIMLCILSCMRVSALEITAHRGYGYKENTLPAIKNAIDCGADWVEIDVRRTKDGILVVNHDDSLKRVHHKNISIKRSKYNKVEKYVPSFADVLGYTQERNQKINIEIKDPAIWGNVLNFIQEYEYETKNIIISSTYYSALVEIEKHMPEIQTLYITMQKPNIKKYNKVDGYSVKFAKVNRKLVNDIHNLNKVIHVWTLNISKTIEKAINLKVDNIITDQLDLINR